MFSQSSYYESLHVCLEYFAIYKNENKYYTYEYMVDQRYAWLDNAFVMNFFFEKSGHTSQISIEGRRHFGPAIGVPNCWSFANEKPSHVMFGKAEGKAQKQKDDWCIFLWLFSASILLNAFLMQILHL